MLNRFNSLRIRSSDCLHELGNENSDLINGQLGQFSDYQLLKKFSTP